MPLVLMLHMLMRWPILAVALLGLVHGLLARGAGGPRPWGRRLGAIFLGLLDLQFLLALILFVRPPLPLGPPKYLHAVAMILALAAAHALRVRQRRLPPERAAALEPLVFGVPLAFILGGLAFLSM
jgi:hypothetical protein